MQARIQYYWLPILSGILIGTSYIPFPPWALFFLYVPLWLWWFKQDSLKKILLGGWLTQMVLTLIGFNWVAYTIYEFGRLPWPAAVIGLLLFSSFAHLQIPLAGGLWWGLRRLFNLTPLQSLWLLPAAHIAMELTYPMIFDWNMGYPLLYAKLPVAQMAEWVGFRGLSALIFVLNGGVLMLWLGRKNRDSRWRVQLATMGTAVVAVNVIGWWLQASLPVPEQKAKVLLVQANIGNFEKQEVEKGDLFRESILQRYMDLTTRGLSGEKPDFALWPETAFPHLLNEPYYSSQSYALQLQLFIKKHKLALATGGYGYQEQTGKMLNSFYTIDEEARQTSPHHSKTKLLAFGEYLPGVDLLPFLSDWLPQVGGFGRGPGPSAMPLGKFTLGPQICYESLFDSFVRATANKGANILVNVTNDSWYGTWQQPWQHMYMTLARAIEVRRPLLRVTNTGFTAGILADGTLLEQSPLHQEWQHLYDVPVTLHPKTTVFMGWGLHFAWALSVALVLWTLGRKWRARTT
ncbi:MAG: apolipoprotein N-acyltransferase [Bdellovibrionales bacterium]